MRSAHLRGYDIGYFPHMLGAMTFGIRCIFWTAEVFIHAFLPDLFSETSLKMKQEIFKLENGVDGGTGPTTRP